MPRQLATFRADLHIHSCLSPCADIDSSPSTIARRARQLGLDMVALTDHNAAENCPAFATACQREGVVPLFGAEITSAEEVHLLCLFDNPDPALAMVQEARQGMPKAPLNEDLYWPQYVVDADENILSVVDFLLTLAGRLSIDSIRKFCKAAGGLCIPAHIDRKADSLLSQLGFVPAEDWDALEITLESSATRRDVAGYTLSAASDSHHIDNIGRRWIEFDAPQCNFVGLAEALREGRVRRKLRGDS